MTEQEHKEGQKLIPSQEIQYYRLEQIEQLHNSHHRELMELISEIKENQDENSKLMIEHDFRIKQLENKNEQQNKYVYGIVILVLTQLVAQLFQFLSP